jgi:CheY-like chemotaxis protein
MPGTDGYELIRTIRRLPAEQGGNTPAVALTAFGRPDDRQKALHAGYESHVSKPVTAYELVTVVAGLAGQAMRQKAS